MEEITKIESIDQYDQLFGLETLHPLVNVIDFSKATKTQNVAISDMDGSIMTIRKEPLSAWLRDRLSG